MVTSLSFCDAMTQTLASLGTKGFSIVRLVLIETMTPCCMAQSTIADIFYWIMGLTGRTGGGTRGGLHRVFSDRHVINCFVERLHAETLHPGGFSSEPASSSDSGSRSRGTRSDYFCLFGGGTLRRGP